MKDLFITFLETQDRESFLAIRSAVLASEHYNPYSTELKDVDELIEAGKFEEAGDSTSKSMPNLLLSAGLHLTRSYISEKLDDEHGALMENLMATACCKGILATGEGTRENPYLVLRPSDEYDLVGYLGKKFKEQHLFHDETKNFDRITCTDGFELWFDITDMFKKVTSQMHKKPE